MPTDYTNLFKHGGVVRQEKREVFFLFNIRVSDKKYEMHGKAKFTDNSRLAIGF